MRETSSWQVDCPFCHARPGSCCRTTSGTPTPAHARRVLLKVAVDRDPGLLTSQQMTVNDEQS